MYKLEKNSPISNISRNVKTFFPNTLWSGQTFLVALISGAIYTIVVHHPSIQPSLSDVTGTLDCFFATANLVTLACTIKNFKKERPRFMELGRQMNIERERKRQRRKQEEAQSMQGFLTPEQLVMKQFTQQDKIIPIDLFVNNDDATGGRQEEVGFSKTLQFPGR